ATSLKNIVINLQDRCQQRGVRSDPHEAIQHHLAPLLLHPTGHIDIHSGSLNNLARSVQTRFEQRSALPDWDENTELYRVALVLCPLGHFLPTLLFQ
ncbi:hypothetical protein BDR03DRAFT_862111, partial [Suillus americanus]